MVERLKAAIEKARQQREGNKASPVVTAPVATVPSARTSFDSEQAWLAMEPFNPDPKTLEAQRLVTFQRSDPTHTVFNILRTRLIKVCRDNGWRRIVITSATKHSGKTTVCANRGGSFAHQKNIRTILLDLDLRNSRLHEALGFEGERHIEAVVDGSMSLEKAILRLDSNLAVMLNTTPVVSSAEMLQSEALVAMLDTIDRVFEPDIVLIDTPPVLVADDVLGLLPHVDAVILVVGAGETTPKDVMDAEQLLNSNAPFLGIVMNKVPEDLSEKYQESYT